MQRGFSGAFDAVKNRLRKHDHARPASERIIIGVTVLVLRKITYIMRFEFQNAL